MSRTTKDLSWLRRRWEGERQGQRKRLAASGCPKDDSEREEESGGLQGQGPSGPCRRKACAEAGADTWPGQEEGQEALEARASQAECGQRGPGGKGTEAG
eukprot:s658_g11.t1